MRASAATSAGVAAKIGASYLFGGKDHQKQAAQLAAALGGLKGPLMKVAQLLATIPDAIPAEYATELAQLQNQAPAMGWPFVRRRMAAELGPDWRAKFLTFGEQAAAAASLGQVHKAQSLDGRGLAVKLQYPEMQSAVEADLNQLRIALAIYKRMDSAIDTSEIAQEIAARLREELDYGLEARHMALYGLMFRGDEAIRVPELLPELSTKRLLTMSWLEGQKLLAYKTRPLEERNVIARALFRAWWYPFSHYAVIHGDPHLGNYTIFEEGGRAAGINLLDYGCIRTFEPKFVGGVIDLYRGLADQKPRFDRARLRDLGLLRAFQRSDRHPEHLGGLHLWAAAGGSRQAHRGGCRARRIWQARGVPRAYGSAREGAGEGAARVRVHGPRGGGARRRVPASGGGVEFLSPVQ